MPVESLGEIGGLLITIASLLALLARYVFIPLRKFTKRLRSNSRQILDSLPVLFDLARHWPLEPQHGSLAGAIEEIHKRLGFHRFWTRSIVDGLNLPAFQTDIEGEITWVSLEWSKLTGLSLEQTLGEGWFSGIAEKDRERVIKEWKNCVLNERLFDIKFSLEDRKGKLTDVRCRGHVVRNDGEEFLGFIGVMLKEENLTNFA